MPLAITVFSVILRQTIAVHFADFRYLLLIPDRYGKIPELGVKVEIEGEQLDAKLMPDGTVQLKPIVRQIKKDGVSEVVFGHATEVEEISSSDATVWNDRVASGHWFLRFLAAVMKAELHE